MINWLQNLYLKVSAKHTAEMQRIEESIKFHQDFIRIEDKLEKMWSILKRWE